MKTRIKIAGWFMIAFIVACTSPIWGIIWVVTAFDIVKFITKNVNELTPIQ